MAVIGPFLPLAEKLGRLAMALAGDGVERIEVATAGQLAGRDTRHPDAAALRGAFSGLVEDVNYVNAPTVAEEHGIEVREQRRVGVSDYTNLLAVTARGRPRVDRGRHDARHRAAAWLVRALGYAVEIELDPRMLVRSRTTDVPGMIGRVGTHARQRERQHRQHERLAQPVRRQRADGRLDRRGAGRALLAELEGTEGVRVPPNSSSCRGSASSAGRRRRLAVEDAPVDYRPAVVDEWHSRTHQVARPRRRASAPAG